MKELVILNFGNFLSKLCGSFVKKTIPFFLLINSIAFSQPACTISPTSNCDPVGSGSVYLMSTSGNADFTFDSFGKFITGITQSGATTLKLAVTEAAAPCRWQLHANIDNNGAAIDEWELVTPYTPMAMPHPKTNLLQIKVRNECNTSLSGTGFNTLADVNQTIDIVESPGVNRDPGFCDGRNVNRPGSYLTNYGEYHFTMDYRIIPTLTLRPGIYQLVIRYCLTEDN